MLKYKFWKFIFDDVWNGFLENDDIFIICWKNFLLSEFVKVLVLDWEIKMEVVKSYLKLFDDENLNENIIFEDGNIDDEREEWMFMVELNVEKIIEFNYFIIFLDGYWYEVL